MVRAPRFQRGEQFKSDWWWWEMGGALVACVSLFMTIAVLAVLDGKPIDDWNHSIEPSSLLSTLTTVGKMGMMLVVASCLSQSKWLHYQHPNVLNHLDVYDEVSRASPVASVTIFWKLPRGLRKARLDVLAILFALITLGSFAIDPMIQQILARPSRNIELKNITTASLGASRNYISDATLNVPSELNNTQDTGQTGNFALQAKLLSQALNTSILPDSECPFPATYCDFGRIRTLGLCRNFTDLTSKTNRTCQSYSITSDTGAKSAVNCTYKVDNLETTRVLNMSFGYSDGYDYDKFRSILDVPDAAIWYHGQIYKPTGLDMGRLFVLRVVDNVTSNFLTQDPIVIPNVQVELANWYWCQQVYENVSFDRVSNTVRGMDTAKTATLAWLGGDSMGPTDLSLGILPDGTLNTFQDVTAADMFTTNFFGQKLRSYLPLLDVKHIQHLDPDTSGVLHPQVYGGNMIDQEVYIADIMGQAAFMAGADLERLTQNIATAITNQVLQKSDNSAFNTTSGKAFGTVVFYHVRWGYIVLPLLEAVATAVLLLLTIFINELPLWKSNNIALLAHGPEEAVDYRVVGAETTNKWEKFGKDIRVMLAEDEKGWMRLIKA